jgi:predicted PurR-regulated permease PerM
MTVQTDSARRILFYALVLLSAYLAYLVISPFLVPLTWAAVFALMFYGLQVKWSRRVGRNRAALIITVLTLVGIVAPTIMLATSLVDQLPGAAAYVQQASLDAPQQVDRIWQLARGRIPTALPEEPGALLQEGVRRVIEFLAPRAGALVANVFATMGRLVAMLFALFFFLRDGETMGRELRSFLPLPPHQADRLIRDTRDLVVASVGAGVAVAIAQGTIGGLAFWLLGLGSPVFWGVVTAFCALVPVVGAAIVWGAAALWLLLSDEIGRSITMALVGVFGISMVDNVLRPLLLSGRTSVSGFVIFFGLLGGAAVFGFIGLVIGPIILVITGNLLRILSQPDE